MTTDFWLFITIISTSFIMMFILNLGEVSFIRLPDDFIDEESEKGNYQAKRIKYYTQHYRHFEIHKHMMSILLLIVSMLMVYILLVELNIDSFLMVLLLLLHKTKTYHLFYIEHNLNTPQQV